MSIGTEKATDLHDRMISVGFERVMQGIAASLEQYGLSLLSDTAVVHGFMAETQIFVHVRWEWLILPVTLTLLSIVFVALTVVSSKMAKAAIWKGSVTALLYHGLGDRDNDNEVALLQTVSAMEHAADKQRVRLRSSKGTGTMSFG